MAFWGHNATGQLNSNILHLIFRTHAKAIGEFKSVFKEQEIKVIFISGGPIQIAHQDAPCVYDIIGLTSFGAGVCGKAPAIYTKVSFYLDWIEKIVWPQVRREPTTRPQYGERPYWN